jgi:Ca2+-binding RTX toxin-like protein
MLARIIKKWLLGSASRPTFAARPVSHRRIRSLEMLERREVLSATLQVIHNSPYAAASLVDVYVNGSLLLDDFAFRSATPFVSVPSGVNLTIDVTGANAPNNFNPVFSATVNLANNKTYLAVAAGDPLASSGPTAFGLALSDLGRQSANNPGNAEFLVFHGVPDAPAVDVVARGVGTLVNDLTFPSFAPDYLSVAPANYTIDVTLADGLTRVRSFGADLSAAAGGALVVAASGFVAPSSGDPAFGLLAVFADGTTALLPEVKPVIGGTGRNDSFVVRTKASNPGIVEVSRGGDTTQFLALTNPVLTIEGGAGNDVLTVRYPSTSNFSLPTIAFDGGRGYDTASVFGGQGNDTIKLIESNSFSVLPGNALAFKAVEALSVWAGDGNDLVDASVLTTINTTLFGENGNDVLLGGRAVDLIYGGLGNDLLDGGAGNDLLWGGFGDDTLIGGGGFDLLFDFFGRNTFWYGEAKPRQLFSRR